MPPVIAIVVGLAVIGTGAGLAATAVIAWSTAISIIATGALFVISAFTRPNIAIDGPKVASQAADANRVIIYGQAMVGGTITYIAATGNTATRLHMVVTLSGHEITSIDGIYFDNYLLQLQYGPNQTGTNGGDVEVWNETNVYQGQVYVEMKLGAPGEPAFPALINETGGLGTSAQSWQADTAYSTGTLITDPHGYTQVCTTGGTSGPDEPAWNDTIDGYTYENPPSTVVWQCLGQNIGSSAWTSAHRQDGCASVHIMMRYSQKLFSNGVPNLRFLVHGKQCVDPRTGETAWSANPAVCIRDFLLDPKYGYRCLTADNGVSSPEINDANFIAAANLCDEGIDLCSGLGTPFGPYSPVLRFGCTGAFNQYARILYWIGTAVYDGTTGNYTVTICSLESANQVRNYITCVVPVGTGIGYGVPDGRLLWAPDPSDPEHKVNFFIGFGNGYGYYSWAKFGLDGGLIGTLGEMSYAGGPLLDCLSACIDSNGNLLHVGLAGIDTGGLTVVTPGQFTPAGTWGNAPLAHNSAAKLAAGLFGQSFVLDGDGSGTALELVTVSGTDPVVTTYALGTEVLTVEFDLEYCFQDGTLLFWWNGNLNKWDRTTASIVASTPSTYLGSGPINSNSLLANGLDVYDPLTLEIVMTGDGYNPGLPAFTTGVEFFHFYDPANLVIWLLADDQNVWGAEVAPPGESRYQLNGAFDTGKTLGDVLQNMLSTCAGKVAWIAGQWNLFPGAWRPPTLAFGDDDLRGAIQVQTKLGRRDVYTGMKGQYIEPLNNWQPTDFPPVVRSSYVALQNGTCQTPNDRGDWAAGQTYLVNDTVISFGYAYVCTANNYSDSNIEPGLGPPAWGPLTSYSVGQFINDGECIQECTTAGTSGGAPPPWNETMGGATNDGTVVWTNVSLNWNGYWLFAGEIFWKDVQYPFTISGTMAQRLARIDLEWGQRQITAAWPMKLQAYQDIPSDVIQITRANFGWEDMTFEVTALKLSLTAGGQGEPPALGVDLTLHQTDAGVYEFEPCDFDPATPPQTLVAGPEFTFDTGGDTWQLDPRDE